MLLGDSFVIVWADPLGRPKVTVESAEQVAVLTDPGTRRITAAVKRWETQTTTEAVLYLPDQIVRLRADQRRRNDPRGSTPWTSSPTRWAPSPS